MEHRFRQRIGRRELSELRLEVDRSPIPIDYRAEGEALAEAIANVPPRICVHPGFSLLQPHGDGF
jgi:hypothetical protein